MPPAPLITQPASFLPNRISEQDANLTQTVADANIAPNDISIATPLASPEERRHSLPVLHDRSESDSRMTTYFQYNPDGTVTGYNILPIPQQAYPYMHTDFSGMYGPPAYLSHSFNPPPHNPPSCPLHSFNPPPHDPLVYPLHSSHPRPHGLAIISSVPAQPPSPEYESFSDHVREQEDYGYYSDEPEYSGNVSHTASASISGSSTQVEHQSPSSSGLSSSAEVEPKPQNTQHYPNPDEVRKYYDLYMMLPWLEPQRVHNSMFGPKVDIVEEETGAVFAREVPKKMLVLFCGRSAVSKFLRTLEREDNENWKGGPTAQELRLPRGMASHVGVKIMVAWMRQAGCWETMGKMQPIRVPRNLFAAICLARTFEVFGLRKDVNRVDRVMSNHHFDRPIYPDEMKSIWQCLPKKSKYIYRMVECLYERVQQYESGVSNGNALPDAEAMLEFIKEQPTLEARIRNPELNARFRPEFGTDWCRKLVSDKKVKGAKKNGLESKKEPEPKQMPKPKEFLKKFAVLRITASAPEPKITGKEKADILSGGGGSDTGQNGQCRARK